MIAVVALGVGFALGALGGVGLGLAGGVAGGTIAAAPAGACSVLEIAQQEGTLSKTKADELHAKFVAKLKNKISELEPNSADPNLSSLSEDCSQTLAHFRQSLQKNDEAAWLNVERMQLRKSWYKRGDLT